MDIALVNLRGSCNENVTCQRQACNNPAPECQLPRLCDRRFYAP